MNINFDFIRQLSGKRLLIVVGFLLLVILMGWGIYFMFFNVGNDISGDVIVPGGGLPTIGTSGDSNLTGSGGLPDNSNISNQGQNKISKIAQGGETLATALSENNARGVDISSDGNGINFYDREENKFYFVDENGNKNILSNKEFFGVQNVVWSNDKTSAIIEYPDGNKILYDFSNDKQISLNKNILDAEFSQTNSIAYKYVTNNINDNWLMVTDENNSEVRAVQALGENSENVQIAWSPNNSVVALYAKSIGPSKSEIFLIGLAEENFKSIEVEGSDFNGAWSPDGKRILYNITNSQNDYKPSLWIVNAQGDDIGRYNLNLGLTTWVDKCVFENSRTVFCAVPKSLTEGAGLFSELFLETDDLIYKIDLTTGRSELIADPIFSEQDKFSISKLFVSKNSEELFFWDEVTEKIYSIKLK